jgi:protoporphyrinogen/coproporphyrinogen III oxidase
MRHVVIVGGGITGLATAYYLHKRGRGSVDCAVVESAPTFGGKIVSSRESGFVVEGGPDSFITQKKAAIELCRELGLGDELINTNDAARKVFVWSRAKLRPMPEGVMLIVPTKITPFLRSSLISWPGKLRMGLDAFIPPRRDDGDETLAHFVRRRLGTEALDKIAEPMIAGIYVADAEKLSLKSTFPRFLDMEHQYGSLLRGMVRQRRAANPSNGHSAKGHSSTTLFMSLRGGLQQMTESLVRQLNPEALLATRSVVGLSREAGGYELALSDGLHLRADAVVLAAPAYVSASLLREMDPSLASKLEAIRYVSTATVSLGFRGAQVKHSLDGFGFVVPRSERRKIIACTWSSTKFDNRAPEEHVLVRAFVGGAHREDLAEQDDDSIARMARAELREMMGIEATPVLTRVYRWKKGNPQYDVGHQDRIAEIDRLTAQHAGLYIAGAAYHGVGIPDCIQDGERVAKQILEGMGKEEQCLS